MARHNQTKVQTQKGGLTVTEHTTDAPLLPVADIEKLHQFRPDLVDFIIVQTEIEATQRRKNINRVNTMIFIEHLIGKIGAFLLGLAGITGGIYAGLHGQPWLGGVIASATIGTLAVAFLKNQSK